MTSGNSKMREALERNRARLARLKLTSFVNDNVPAVQMSFVDGQVTTIQPQHVWREAQRLTRAAATSEIFMADRVSLDSADVRNWILEQITPAIGADQCVLWLRQFDTDAWLRACTSSPKDWAYALWSKLRYRDMMVKSELDNVIIVKEREYSLYAVCLSRDALATATPSE